MPFVTVFLEEARILGARLPGGLHFCLRCPPEATAARPHGDLLSLLPTTPRHSRLIYNVVSSSCSEAHGQSFAHQAFESLSYSG